MARRFEEVYHCTKTGSPRSGCMTCWTPQESGFSSPYGGNCFPTVRLCGHDPALVSAITRSHASSSSKVLVYSGSRSPGTTTYPC